MSKNPKLFHTGREGLRFVKQERCYPTGCEVLNLAIGRFDPITGRPGIPAATVVEAFGPNASLKTGLWESLAANIHKLDAKAKVFALLSEEPDYERFESVGIDLDRIHCWTYYNLDDPNYTTSAEEGLNLLNELVSEDMDIRLVVVDSIKALVSMGHLFDKSGDLRDLSTVDPMAARAVLMNRFTGQFAASNKSRAILFMVNQTSESIGPSYLTGGGIKTQTAGGRGKEHWAKLRIECNSAPPDASDKPEEHGMFKNKIYDKYRVIYYLQKNKYGYPFRRAISDFDLHEKRFMNERNCLAIAVFMGIVQRKGNSHWTLDGKSVQGKEAAERFLAENLEYQQSLWEQIYPRHEEFFGTAKSKSAKEDLDD